MEDLWMYFDYASGRMLALGTKREIERVAKQDFEYLTQMAQAKESVSTLFPTPSGME